MHPSHLIYLRQTPNRFGNMRVTAIRELHSMYKQNEINLEPDYQRGSVWTLIQKQILIESLLLGFGIGAFALVYRGFIDGKHIEVVDGKQRLEAIFDFLEGRFAIHWHGKELFFSDFDMADQRSFKMLTVSENYVSITRPEEDLSRLDVLSYFYRVNFAGTPQSEEHRTWIENEILKELSLASH